MIATSSHPAKGPTRPTSSLPQQSAYYPRERASIPPIETGPAVNLRFPGQKVSNHSPPRLGNRRVIRVCYRVLPRGSLICTLFLVEDTIFRNLPGNRAPRDTLRFRKNTRRVETVCYLPQNTKEGAARLDWRFLALPTLHPLPIFSIFRFFRLYWCSVSVFSSEGELRRARLPRASLHSGKLLFPQTSPT